MEALKALDWVCWQQVWGQNLKNLGFSVSSPVVLMILREEDKQAVGLFSSKISLIRR